MTQWADNSDLVEITPRNTTMSIALDGTFDDYWNNRKKKLTRNIRRYLKRLDRTSAKVTLEILTKHEDVVAAVAEYGMLESTGWKGKQGTSIHPDSKDGLFYQELFSEFSKLSNAKIYRLRLNNSVIASRLLVYHNGIMVSLKITYDEDFAEFAPGRVLLYLFLKDAFKQRDVQKIEFYTHANIDQLQWSTGRKSMYQVIIYRYSYYRRPLAVTRSIKNILLKRKSQLLVMIFSNRYLESLTPNIASKFTQHHSRH